LNPPTILLSVKPNFALKIFSGEKDIELRRVLPKRIDKGSLVVVYASNPLKKVIGIFRVKKINTFKLNGINKNLLRYSCISKNELLQYFKGKKYGNAIHIAERWEISDKSIKFRFKKNRKLKPPQNFCYINIDDIDVTNKNMVL